jgi:hypothetical protein
MHPHSHLRRAIIVILGLGLFSLPALVAAQQSAAEESSTGRMRSEVTLGFRTVAVVSTPALQADDPAHSMLLSNMDDSRDGFVRVGQLNTDASISVGAAEIEVDEPEEADAGVTVGRYDLWLAGTSDGWRLHVAEAQAGAATQPFVSVVGSARLAHTTAAMASPTLTAGIVPTGSDAGELILRWGLHEWTTALEFAGPRVQVRARRESGVGADRSFEFDSSDLQRASRLGRRNIATATLPDGASLAVIYPRDLNVEDRDFSHLVSVAAGAVVRVTANAVIRLDIDAPLQFGDVTLETGNQGALRGAPGSYGVWLKRTAAGWRLVFNEEPDAWGSQHDPMFDVGEVDLEYSYEDDSSRSMSASVVMTTADQGQFVLVWGPHEWTADFAVAR